MFFPSEFEDDSTDAGASVEPGSADALSQYLLVCGATATSFEHGSWQFSLETSGGELVLEASDDEIGDLNRLHVLAALRGLEAIDGASSVTLLSSNRYLIRSLTDSLPRWRRNQFAWEHFGRRIDVQHADLWRRVDRALAIHRVEACLVSSRIVSAGAVGGFTSPANALMKSAGDEQHEPATDSDVMLRLDTWHEPANATDRGSRNSIPVRRRRRGHRPEPVDLASAVSDSGNPALLPQDRLRKWLLTSSGGDAGSSRGRRFTAAEFRASG